MLSDTLPYVPTSETSKAAATSMIGGANAIRRQVFDAIQNFDEGLTCDEVETLTGLRHQTASARVCELREAGLIEATGVKRATRSGRKATVFRAAVAA